MKTPTLYGDGIHDDTAAIQALLDSESHCIALPEPKACYLISKPLKIGSNKELVLGRFSVIRLAANSNCLMITNSDYEGGNCNIAITGGIWDYNNLEQAPNPQVAPHMNPPCPGILPDTYPKGTYHHDRYRGILMRLIHVDNFTMRGVTFRNPINYATQFAKLTNFLIDDITFDFNTFNPTPNNMDGIHFDGGCRFGRVSNLRGTTYDDLVAINADDGLAESPYMGEISDIDVDGIFSTNCHSAVRLLSSGSPIRRISIRNVYGTFYRYIIGFTHYPKRARGLFDDITLENIRVHKARPLPNDFNHFDEFPVIRIEEEGDITNLTIRDLRRDEDCAVSATIDVDANASVSELTVESSGTRNHLPEPCPFCVNRGSIGLLTLRNIHLEKMPTAGDVPLLTNNGTIVQTILTGNTEC